MNIVELLAENRTERHWTVWGEKRGKEEEMMASLEGGIDIYRSDVNKNQ